MKKINELATERGLDFDAAKEIFLAQRGGIADFMPPERVAELIVFLCRDSSRDITGAAIPIDQGRSAYWLEPTA